jgi:hypothetical protein
MSAVPPLPEGFVLDKSSIQDLPPLPSGFIVEKEEIEKPIPGYRSVLKGVSKAIQKLPHAQLGPVSSDASQKLLEEVFPTPKEGLYPYVESISEGAAEGAKYGPFGAIAGGIGSGLEELAKQQNAPQWVQTLAGIAPWLFTKKGLIPKKNQKEVVKFLKKEGFSDSEITPLIQEDRKLSWFSKLGKRGFRVQNRLDQIKNKFDESYDLFRQKGKSLELPRKNVSKFENIFEEAWEDLPTDQRKILSDLKQDLMGKPITRASLRDFYHAANRSRADKGIIRNLKDKIYEGMDLIDPSAGKDFKMLNELNEKKYKVFEKLKPSQLDRLMSVAEFATGMKYLSVGDWKGLAGVVGEISARQLLSEMLINPYLQNISNRMGVALAKNQIPIYEKLKDKFLDDLKKSNPDLYKKVNQKLVQTKRQSKPNQ